MKKTRIISAACILASLILLAGCQKGLGNHGGQPVRFGASTKSSPMAKAAYSGEGTFSNGLLTWERINWESSDKVRIASNYAYVADGGDGGINAGVHYADYSLTINDEQSDPTKHKATLAPLAGNTNGLVWNDEEGSGYAFYAVYPCTYYNTNILLGSEVEGEGQNKLGVVTATLPATQTLASSSSTRYVSSTGAVADDQGKPFTAKPDGGYTYSVYAPDKDIMFLSAAKTGVASGAKVELEFKPIYTAFEFHITTQDEAGLTIKKISLTSTGTDYLAGTYSLTAGDVSTAAIDADSKTADNQIVSMSLGNGLALTTDTGAALSLLTLPIANTKALTLKLTDSVNETASLPLVYATATEEHAKGAPFVFEAGKKYRVNLLKVGTKWKYAISVSGMVLSWDYSEDETTYSENVQAKAFDVNGAIENLESYRTAQSTIDLYGKATSNHYEAYDPDTNNAFLSYAQWVALGSGQAAYNVAHPNYYSQYYQLRTLDMTPANRHFEVTFTPIAPLGGYWTLSTSPAPSYGNTSQGGPEGFRIVLYDGESELENWSSGQIMGQEINLRIYPSAQRDPSKEYCMLIKAYFSPNKNGEPTYSADSELQDVHGDGRYSYWKFVIPASE